MHQQSFDTVARDVRAYVKLPSKRVQIWEHHDELLVNIKKFRARRDATVLKVRSAETRLASLRFSHDIEHNCRGFNIDASEKFRRWISRNPPTCSNGRMSFKCDLTVPRSQVKFVSFFDPD